MKIGAQLYTLREYCKTEKDFGETLKKVAEMGYRSVQVSGTCPYDPEWLAERLSENGLTCDLTHIPFDRLQRQPDSVIADHLKFGCHHIGIGGYNGLREEKDVDAVVALAKQIAPAMRESGCLFFYHNHYTEMNRNENGETRLMELVRRTQPDELGVTLDTYWLQYGGGDLSDYITALKGRIACVHFKDFCVVGDEIRMTTVGEGSINFDKLVRLCEASGTEHIFVEQDNCYGESPFDCLARSLAYLRSLGLSQ